MGNLAHTITRAVRDASTARNGMAVAAALNCVEPADLAEFFHESLPPDLADVAVGEGLPASPGAASGRIVLTADDAIVAGDNGEAVILVRSETTPDDVLGMQAARGILTIRGGLVSHAAVVARGWGIPAVVGASMVHIDGNIVTVGEQVLHAGDEITIDGSSGKIYVGTLVTSGADAPAELDTLLAWADAVAHGTVQVRANVDTEGDSGVARALGAQGIGLCRTEHMFLAADRLHIMRRFILSNDHEAEVAALAELEAAQIVDFESVLGAMDGLPVTVRLLDPPLHEFLPDLVDLAVREALGQLSDDQSAELAAVRRLHESNPMIGTRGVRLGFVRTGVYQMQVRALCTAAANLFARGKRPMVEIMIPLVVDAEELRTARSWVRDVLDEIGHPELRSTVVTVGAMIETPRAALTAAALAEHADFFSFGTNDLTQMTYAFSRDDVEATLLPAYRALGVLPDNPFAVLDQEGVGELIRIACRDARAAKPTIKLGACGEHAGHPPSAAFLVQLGVDSVSCSPFRVPMARLGVAQALLACGRVQINEITFDFDAPGVGGTNDAAPELDEVLPADETLVLHALRVRGWVTPVGFVNTLGAYPVEILEPLVAEGLVRHLEARDMYGLLPPGKERHATLLDDLAPPDVRSGLGACYQEFLELNNVFKQLCTDWQMRGGEPNDHADTEYDRRCTDRLIALMMDSDRVVADLATILPRMSRYSSRLRIAAGCVGRGETNRFTGVMCESFHDIWMELHEDLIVMLRIDRVEEGSF